MDDLEKRVAEIAAQRNGEKPKGKGGRPKAVPRVSEEVIGDLAALGCTNDEMAAITGVSWDTLDRRFAEVIKKGRATVRMSLRRQQIATALDKRDPAHGTMLVWLGKVMLEQKDTSRMEMTGADGGPIAHAETSSMSQADLIAEAESILTAASKARRGSGGVAKA